MQLCMACSSTIDGSSAGPSNSEKPAAAPTALLCGGGHVVCSSCVAKNRRLARSCLLCGTVDDVLRGSADASDSRHRSNLTDDFVLGESDDDDEQPPPLDDEQPPAYNLDDVGTSSATEKENEAPTQASRDEKKRQDDQVQVHYIKPDETLLGLAMRYRVDGRTLCQINKLPTSTLSTTPQLLHTLPFLLLPPGARSMSTEPLRSPADERRRLIVRRFQMHTRCADWAMAQAYCQAVFDAREKEAAFANENRRARQGQDVSNDVGQGGVREGGELEEAIAMYQVDEKWEKEQKGKMGSRLKSTGAVEGKVKGWSWPK